MWRRPHPPSSSELIPDRNLRKYGGTLSAILAMLVAVALSLQMQYNGGHDDPHGSLVKRGQRAAR